MSSKWKECKLGNVVNLKRGYDLPKSKRQEGNVPVVSSSGITGHHNEAKVKAPGVVTGRYGTLGEIHYIEKDFWPLNTTLYVQDFKGNDPRYVSYLLLTLNFAVQNVAAAVPGVNRNFLHQLSVRVPPPPIQRKIAAVLSAYDDLIENNARRIAILEETARLLYREWFVHFHFPGHEQVAMVDSPLGLIPERWRVKSVGELLSYHIGGGWGKAEPSDKYPVPAYVIRGTDIPGARHIQVGKCPQRFHTQSNFNSRQLQNGDIVFEVSGGSKDQPVGRALLISQQLLDAFDEEVICASFCKLLRINPELLTAELFYLHLLETYDTGQIEKYQVQSTGIKNFKFAFFLQDRLVVVPDQHWQARFGSIVIPMFGLITALGTQNANLRRTRDLLLPRLISGEVDFSDLSL